MHAAVLKDCLLPGTPFRGLVLQGPFSLCAYLGVPDGHWLANMEELEFDCHWGVTFRGPGDAVRPVGYYWFGWDYAHAGDELRLPGHTRAFAGLRGKRWSLEEVHLDLIDAAVTLMAALQHAEQVAAQVSDPARR